MFLINLKKSAPAYFFWIILLIAGQLSLTAQELKPSSLFTDHMVLQRDQQVPVWGTAAPNELVTVRFEGQTKSVYAGSKGNWRVDLDPLSASSKGSEMIISARGEHIISDILVGDVWICSGQSNMQWPVNKVPEIKGLIPFYKNIRSFEVKRTVSLSEKETLDGSWTSNHPKSAVAFSFAYFLEDLSEVPVGIITAAWGSSSIEAWTPRHLTLRLPHFQTIMEEFDRDTATHNLINRILGLGDARTNSDDIFLRRQPNILYNAMIKPLVPFACKGFVWYQGERNTRYLSGMPEVSDANWFHRVIGMKEYGDVLNEWIKSYRQLWQNDKMFFSIVMLPGYGKGTQDNAKIDPNSPSEESWAWMRQSQMQILDLPYTSVINTIDLGDVKNIHPSDKLPIGQRLALEAASKTLYKEIVSKGPMMSRVDINDDSLIVYFENAQKLKTTNDKSPTGFWLADETGIWKPARATIVNNTVVLRSEAISHPKYIRYAFAGKPDVNLVNEIELTAYPFRTDTFEH